MEWIRADRSFYGDTDVGRLARGLRVERTTAAGLVASVWCWAAGARQNGDLSDLDAVDLADACRWHTEPEATLQGLIDTGFLTRPDGRLTLPWPEKGKRGYNWFRLDQAFWGHTKVGRLARLLSVDRATAAGIVLSIWCWAAGARQDGDLSGLDPADLADACRWHTEAAATFQALLDAGFLERDDHDGARIHDWMEKQSRSAKARAAHARRQTVYRDRLDSAAEDGTEPTPPLTVTDPSPNIDCCATYPVDARPMPSENVTQPSPAITDSDARVTPESHSSVKTGRTDGRTDGRTGHLSCRGAPPSAPPESRPRSKAPDRQAKTPGNPAIKALDLPEDRPGPDDDDPPDLRNQIRAVYRHYLTTMGLSPGEYSLTPGRRGKLRTRLTRWEPSALCRAIDACRASPWHMGEDPRNVTLYNDLIDHILKTDEKVEYWLRRGVHNATSAKTG